MSKSESSLLARPPGHPSGKLQVPVERSHKFVGVAENLASLPLLFNSKNNFQTRRDAPAPISPSEPASGYSGIEERSQQFHSFLEHLMVFVYPLVFLPALYLSIDRLIELNLTLLIVVAMLLGWAFGDFVTGFVHWAADTYGTENTPLIGRSLIVPFRQHHVYPRDICTHGLVLTIGNTCLLAVPLVSVCLCLLANRAASGTLAFTLLTVLIMTVATVATNQFHKWAHGEKSSRGVRWLQRTGLILRPAHHQLHHAGPFDQNYCITSGWLNPALNRVQFFRRLESILSALGIHAAEKK